MHLHLLPFRTAGAAENMATDFLMLNRYPDNGYLRFRHYAWHRPAFTFGYSQKIVFVREQLPPDEKLELCRRPTGGGLVDHRNDWTYCLVIPRGHPLEEAPAGESYRTVHSAAVTALNDCGQAAMLKTECEPPGAGKVTVPTVCFTRPELHDVVHPATGAKIAGAALKRNKRGLLIQGSFDRAAVDTALDWDRFQETFAQQLATTLATTPGPGPWPDFSEGELDGLIEQYSSPEWNEFR